MECKNFKLQLQSTYQFAKYEKKNIQFVVTENIHTLPTDCFFWFETPPPGNYSLGSYFPLKILAFH